MKRSPWMPLYVDDCLASCADLTAEEFGGYMRLLMYIWSRGPIEADEAVVCRVAGVSPKVWLRISKRFDACKREDGTNGWSQRRLEAERLKRWAKGEERSSSGKRGAASRWNGSAIGSANSKPMACHNHNQISKSNVVSTSGETRTAPPFEGGGLPRLIIKSGDETDDATERNRAFVRAHRSKP